MNLGLITSYIIAGIILLSILMMNLSLSNSSTEITFTNMKRAHMSAISEIFASDLGKMGYNRKARLDPIFTVADSNRITFRSNIDNSADESVETISWELTTTGVPGTGNPNDYILTRTVDGATQEFKQGVVKFLIRYYDTHGVPTTDYMSTPVASGDFDSIRQIQIAIELQSADKINTNSTGGGYYVRTIWEKRLSPLNLQN